MKKINFGPASIWTTILIISVIFTAFILPALPVLWHHGLIRIVYSVMYISALFALEKRKHYVLYLFVITLLLEWLSAIYNLPLLLMIARATNIIFFIVIVLSLIGEVARAREVNLRVIMMAITGYLLMGIIYSIFVMIAIQNDPESFSGFQSGLTETGKVSDSSIPMYFSFVTLASLGYGDILPLKPFSRSLATFITVSGQIYIATIIALLVGKFSSKSN